MNVSTAASALTPATAVDPTKPKSTLSTKKLADIDQSAKEFESMFIGEMLTPMFDTVPTDSEFGGGEAEGTWKSLMIQQYGKQVSAAGGIGLSDSIKAKMIEMQEAAQGKDVTASATQNIQAQSAASLATQVQDSASKAALLTTGGTQ